MSNPAGNRDRRQVRAIAQTALEGVRQGEPEDQIVTQLQQAGILEPQARRLVQYAREVELLNTAAHTAAEGVRLGRAPREILDDLRRMGIDDLVAAGIEERARRHHQRSLLRSGTVLLGMGLLWLAAAASLLIRGGLQELKLGICGFGLGFPLIWLGWQKRCKAAALHPMKPTPTKQNRNV